MTNQLELSIPTEMQELDVRTVSKQPSFTASLILCQTLAGLEDKELCGSGGIIKEAATWSRIKTGANNFPQDNLLKFMDVCANEAPLIWLADRRGYTLTRKETEWERQARKEHEEKLKLIDENKLLRSMLTGRRAS